MKITSADTALFLAIHQGHIEGVEKALSDGASLVAVRKYHTPLLASIFLNQAPIAKLLVEAGAPVFATQYSREPISAAMWKGGVPLLAALLRVNDDVNEVAHALAKRISNKHNTIPLWDVGRSLLSSRWSAVFLSLIQQGLLDCQSKRDWWMQLSHATPCQEAIDALQEANPIENAITQDDMISSISRGYPALPLLKFLAQIGWLGRDELFNIPTGTQNNLFCDFFRRHYVAMPVLRWLIQHASKQEGGREALQKSQPYLLPHCLGSRGSWPLARLFCKSTNTDLYQSALTARDEEGRSCLHLLVDTYGDYARRLTIAKALLEAGMDPMCLDKKGVPACYGVVFYRKFTQGGLEMMAEFGADFSPSGLVVQALDGERERHIRTREEAERNIAEFYVNQSSKQLQALTPSVTICVPPRRI